MSLLRLSGLTRRFGPTVALDGASLAVAAGEVHALVGENGAGKSTLMGIVAGTVVPDAGEMWLDGRPYRPRSPRDARAHGVTLVHQELSLFPHLSVTDNILVGLETHRAGWLDVVRNRTRTRDALAVLERADLDPDALVRDLPIARRQVVEICRAFAADARIVLLDEPTSSLPRDDVERLFRVVRRLAAAGLGVVYISHALEEVRAVASRITILRDGRTVASGPMTDWGDEAIVAQMAGRSIDRFFPARTRVAEPANGVGKGFPPGGKEGRDTFPVALSVRDLVVPPAVHGASFDVRHGEILGIAGLVGSGRSTLVRAIFGLRRATSGDVVMPGVAGDRTSAASSRIANGVGFLSEDRREEGLAVGLSVADNVTLTGLGRCSRGGLIDLRRQAAQATIQLTRVQARVATTEQPVRTLSGGNQQKVALARLLHQGARILLLDEPTRGIDVASKAQIYEAIAALAAEGCAIVLVSSYLPELLGLCDRIAVMRRGRLLPARPVDAWTEHALLEQALGLESELADQDEVGLRRDTTDPTIGDSAS